MMGQVDSTIVAASCCVAVLLGCREATPGEWDLRPVEVWRVDGLDGQPAEPRLAEDGTVTYHDFENHISHLYGARGEEIARIAPRGDAPGEVDFYINAFWAGQSLAIAAPDRLHLFDKSGRFVAAYPNNLFERFPLHFLDDATMLAAPSRANQSNPDTAYFERVDLTNGESRSFAQIPVSKGRSGPPGLVILGLTPQAFVSHDAEADSYYLGWNEDPAVHVMDRDGHELQQFRLQEERRPISLDEKTTHLARSSLPPERIEGLAAELPDSLAYYRRMTVQGGRLWVFPAESIDRDPTSLAIHIYDDQGMLRFRTRLSFGDWRISGNPDNVQINGDRVVAILINAAGERRLAVYRITLP